MSFGVRESTRSRPRRSPAWHAEADPRRGGWSPGSAGGADQMGTAARLKPEKWTTSIGRSERVDLGLEAVRVDLHLLLDDVLPALDRGLHAPFDVGRGDHDEPAGAGIEQLAEVLEV
jgi:hypothetical protein